ncbi:hypothetical protein DA423_00345 [Clostridioides difficile]|uniref:hypothetical protein n=1 Tax=Clostridioides difficile TaxID=1496 RepID=UPI00111F868D|nr:hypothetical protein [Clostridioides difficile]TOY35156.1 hypothetical protein DA423_00345 [Clostridioides difficile]
MKDVDYNFINSILRNQDNKKNKCYESAKLFQQWYYSNQSYFNYFSTESSQYEIAQIINSNKIYLNTIQSNRINKSHYNPRQLIMVDLGINLNCLSYKHPCIVMYELNEKVFVIPCTSGNAPLSSYTGIILNGYMEGDIGDGFSHKTTLKLKESKFIDKTQILYSIKEDNKNKKNIN